MHESSLFNFFNKAWLKEITALDKIWAQFEGLSLILLLNFRVAYNVFNYCVLQEWPYAK